MKIVVSLRQQVLPVLGHIENWGQVCMVFPCEEVEGLSREYVFRIPSVS